ncbi:thiamine pyrophosphate-dependent enzyme [Rothia sp. (in: high G+C Gram-positive bacteria)]|uniref:thiamine pyrophosphate-dependent enzyme n=1 Tax=Rothia sp. (in: high G+C Gram-positive bacteria) TaxID=1885016 RepID=UPI0034CE0E04
MDENGTVHEHPVFSAYVQDVDASLLRDAYRLMYLTRRFDDEATALQRQGKLALWVPSRGQEAAQVGSAFAFAPNDYIFPQYREHAVALHRGVDVRGLIEIFGGAATAGWDPRKHNHHVLTKVLGASTLHAVGYAMGLKLDARIAEETGQLQTGQGQATDPATDSVPPSVISYFGDGTSTEGDVHEAMVFAASFDAPVLFFVQNNRWAISVPFDVQSRVPISTRAAGYGFEGLRVDGNDVLGTLAVTRYAMEKIRKGEGPVLIEAETYRLGAHTTADDPTKYRTDEDLAGPLKADPLIRMEKYLRENSYADDSFFEEIESEGQKLADYAREVALNLQAPDFDYFFDRAYAAPHAQVEQERAEYREYMAGFEEE